MRILLLPAVLGLSGCVISDFGPSDRFHTDFHYVYPLHAGARVDAESFNGSIEIEGWDRNEVEISGSKYASTEEAREAIKIDVHHTDDSVEVRAIKPSSRFNNMGAKFTLHVPRSAQVDRVATSNASIQVQDVARAAHLRSSNGSIHISRVHGRVDAHTSNAPVDVEDLDGEVTLQSSNGHIHAEKMTGSLEASTSNSGIVADMAISPSAPIKLHSSNGSVELTMRQNPEGDIRADTSNNSITLHLPPPAAGRISADTSNSKVSCDFDLSGENQKGHLKGTIGTGGHNIELSTSNGQIRIAKGVSD
jgi:hypothetical protein